MRKPVLIAALIIPVLLLVFAGCDSQKKRQAEELKAIEEKNKDFVVACTEELVLTISPLCKFSRPKRI